MIRDAIIALVLKQSLTFEQASGAMEEIMDGEAVPFTTVDYIEEIRKYSDPTDRDRLTAFTGRNDLFEDIT